MEKKTISIPEGVYYLGDYPGLVAQLPQGRYILNKVMTGCGATTMFLGDNVPTVLCSPRRELIRCKAESSDFKGLVHAFGANSADVMCRINDMKQYVTNHAPTPYNIVPPPKILVTYDSAKHVMQGLKEMGLPNQFRFVVDEFQTLFTDAAFRGDVEAEFMENLQYIPNVVYLSATPYIEKYLDYLDEFNALPYVELVWPDSSKHVTTIHKERYHNGSQAQTIADIINKYKSRGCFEESMDPYGNVQYATEAVFFVNDISFILSTVKKNGLTPKDTNIICADNDENKARLKKEGFSIGHAPAKDMQHPTYTFVTKASFEGTDFYSPCAYTYIFSNVKQETLGVDISLDLPQIMGRQRLDTNPFRYSATLFFRTTMSFSPEEEQRYMNKIKTKEDQTKYIVNDFANCKDERMKEYNARKYRNSQKAEKYQYDYVSVVDDKSKNDPKVVFNKYVMLNEIRAWEVQRSQYVDDTYVMGAVDDAFRLSTPATQELVRQFLSDFNGPFEKKMKMYAEFLEAHPECKYELQGCVVIPNSIKNYYIVLGYNRLKSLSWKEINIQVELNMVSGTIDDMGEVILKTFTQEWYSLSEAKQMLQSIYDQYSPGKTAKATDLKKYLKCKMSKRVSSVSGIRENGYLIL